MPDVKQIFDLDQKNRNWIKTHKVRVHSSELYAGERCVKERGQRYLFRTESESAKLYNFRLCRAHFDNWLVPGVTARQSLLWEKSPSRDKFDPVIEELIEDVDGLGTSADVFFMSVTERAMVEGMRWVLVDKTNIQPDGVPDEQISVQAAQEIGLRPFFRSIPGELVFDWHVGDDRKLLWVVIAQFREERDGPGAPIRVIPQRLVWTRQEWILYEPEGRGQSHRASSKTRYNVREEENELDTDVINSSGGGWKEVSRGAHDMGEVPIVCFYGLREEPFLGWPVTKDILGKVIAVYNKQSDRETAEFKTNNPIPWVKAERNPEKVTVVSDGGIYLPQRQDGPEPAIGYLEHNGVGITLSRDSERDIIKRIFEIQLQSMRSETRQVQSEGSLKQESKLFHSGMTVFAMNAEMAEAECWRLMAKWQGIGEFKGTIVYQRDFSDKLITDAMVKSFSDLQDRGQLSLETLLKVLIDNEVLPGDTDINQEIRRIEDELEKRVLPGFGSKTPTNQPGDPNNPKPNADPEPDDDEEEDDDLEEDDLDQ